MLHSIKEPQLLIFGEKDPYIKPSIKEAVSVFCSQVKNLSVVSSKIIISASHSYVGFEKELVEEIVNWTKQGSYT